MDTWLFRPPVLVGERIVWLGSGSGLPQGGIVRWIGKLPEMGADWTVGVELVGIFNYKAHATETFSHHSCVSAYCIAVCLTH